MNQVLHVKEFTQVQIGSDQLYNPSKQQSVPVLTRNAEMSAVHTHSSVIRPQV